MNGKFALKINDGDKVDEIYLKHILSELKNHNLDIKWCNLKDLTYYPNNYELDRSNFLLFYKGELGLSRAPSVISLSYENPVTWTCPHLGDFTLYFDSRFIEAIAEHISGDTQEQPNKQPALSDNKWNTKCPACGAPAYNSGFTVECSKKCGGCY